MGDKESHKKRKKVQITLDNVYSCVLQRYTPSAVITMYQEISQASFANNKIDWKHLASRTSTGITNAREYQMLWRHLAYGHPLDDMIQQDAQLLDDDSDLEIDLEAVPLGSAEDIADALASVQVLLASGLASDLRTANNAAADANSVPNEKQNGTASENAHFAGNGGLHTNLLSYKSTDGLDVNGRNLPFRKKRNPWTEEEDKELITAVNKCGEGNWANILRGDFNGERTASQLSQRWAILKRRNKNIGLGGSNINGQQLSQVHLATRNALCVALSMPVNLTNSGTTTSSTISGSISAINPTEASLSNPALQVPEGLPQTSTHLGVSSATLKNRLDIKKPPMPVKPSLSASAMLQAAAVAAGARIATPEDAESLLKAAQAKNAVYIMNGGGIKSGIGPLPSSHLETPHFAGVAMAGSSISNSSVALPNVPKVGLTKPPATTAQSNAAPSITSEKPYVSKTKVSTIAKQFQVTNKLVNESDVVDKPKDCQLPIASNSPAEESRGSTSLNSEVVTSSMSESTNPAEMKNTITTENGKGSPSKMVSNNNLAAS